jgi:DMSO reductase anchor subunit
MHPAFSVIFFTVVSGAGYGLFMWLVIMHLTGFGPAMSQNEVLTQGILSLVLITAGLMSSTFHLANPKNAWRAVMRFKTSWLSREGVFAIIFYPFALLYLLGVWLNGPQVGGFFALMAVIGAVLALITVFSTGMIYACLKTIRQWNTALTPANYILLGLMLGAVLFAAVHAWFGGYSPLMNAVALAMVALAAVMKAIYYFWIKKVTGPTINTATGFTRAQVRLLDTGHTAGTFLTEEFGYDAGAGLTRTLKSLVFILGFIVPALLLIGVAVGMSPDLVTLALISALVGIGMERWLFFAEARHVIMLYHGQQHT